jgi:hypothetical protein
MPAHRQPSGAKQTLSKPHLANVRPPYQYKAQGKIRAAAAPSAARTAWSPTRLCVEPQAQRLLAQSP